MSCIDEEHVVDARVPPRAPPSPSPQWVLLMAGRDLTQV